MHYHSGVLGERSKWGLEGRLSPNPLLTTSHSLNERRILITYLTGL